MLWLKLNHGTKTGPGNRCSACVWFWRCWHQQIVSMSPISHRNVTKQQFIQGCQTSVISSEITGKPTVQSTVDKLMWKAWRSPYVASNSTRPSDAYRRQLAITVSDNGLSPGILSRPQCVNIVLTASCSAGRTTWGYIKMLSVLSPWDARTKDQFIVTRYMVLQLITGRNVHTIKEAQETNLNEIFT